MYKKARLMKFAALFLFTIPGLFADFGSSNCWQLSGPRSGVVTVDCPVDQFTSSIQGDGALTASGQYFFAGYSIDALSSPVDPAPAGWFLEQQRIDVSISGSDTRQFILRGGSGAAYLTGYHSIFSDSQHADPYDGSVFSGVIVDLPGGCPFSGPPVMGPGLSGACFAAEFGTPFTAAFFYDIAWQTYTHASAFNAEEYRLSLVDGNGNAIAGAFIEEFISSDPSDPPGVPEPATTLTCGAGVAFVVARALRKRRA